MRNPFSANMPKDKLINISSGETLVSTKLVEARKLGLEAMRAASTSDAEKISTPQRYHICNPTEERQTEAG